MGEREYNKMNERRKEKEKSGGGGRKPQGPTLSQMHTCEPQLILYEKKTPTTLEHTHSYGYVQTCRHADVSTWRTLSLTHSTIG